MLKKFIAAVVLVSGVGFAGVVDAASVEFDYDPVTFELFGASNVSVGGSLYDVQFINGTCALWKNGCDPTKLAFITATTADLANQALLDQVLLDISVNLQWDSDPGLTHGIDAGTTYAFITTPFALATPIEIYGDDKYYETYLENLSGLGDGTSFCSIARGCTLFDASFSGLVTWADWTPVSAVPLPPSAILFGTALLGLGAMRRRKKRPAA